VNSPAQEAAPRAVDGRSARRERNSEAVLEAAHSLFVEQQQVPNVEEVAARAGVSLRSVYRYFPDTRQLMAAALERRTRAVEQDWHLPRLGEGTLPERISRFVDHRLFLYEKSGDTIRAAFALADREPAIARQVEHRRDQLAVQTRQHFAPDIDDLAPAAGDALLACIEALFQFESLELLRSGMGMTQERTREVLVAGLTALLHRPS
jgi:AcrR family transcriptional regulator